MIAAFIVVVAAGVAGATGDAAKLDGDALIERFECVRCHLDLLRVVDSSDADANQDRSCVGCHRAILNGDLKTVKKAQLQQWSARIVHLRDTPSIGDAAGRLRTSWIASYVLNPRHLRRGMSETMPRLPITKDEASAIAVALTKGVDPPVDSKRGDPTRGFALLERYGCGTCHAFTGSAKPLTSSQPPAVPIDGIQLAGGMMLAPDFKETRERTSRGFATAWLKDEAKPSSGTFRRTMPSYAKKLEPAEIDDIVAALFDSPLTPLATKKLSPLLPVLSRKVTFAEVQERVLSKTCVHCHADDDKKLGVGGPGNSGGFGYQPLRLVLTSYERVQAGSEFSEPTSPDLKRHSIFRKVEKGPLNGLPLLVAQLRARQVEEEEGRNVDGVVGMPLGLPALSPEDVQLVRTWVAQGRPQ